MQLNLENSMVIGAGEKIERGDIVYIGQDGRVYKAAGGTPWDATPAHAANSLETLRLKARRHFWRGYFAGIATVVVIAIAGLLLGGCSGAEAGGLVSGPTVYYTVPSGGVWESGVKDNQTPCSETLEAEGSDAGRWTDFTSCCAPGFMPVGVTQDSNLVCLEVTR